MWLMNKAGVIKNLSDGNIYTPGEISRLVNVSIDEVCGVLSDPTISKTCGDGSGVIYYMDIKYDTIVDGIGFRNAVYCAGCDLHCKGCHNPLSWDIENGKPITVNELGLILSNAQYDITFSGGECSLQANAFIKLARKLKSVGKNIWLYSGHRFETLIDNPTTLELLRSVDVLVDGEFIQSQKGINMVFRGSSNQRIIDLNETFLQKKIITLDF